MKNQQAMRVGTPLINVLSKRMLAATFHPEKDEWYVLYRDLSGPVILTLTDGVCSKVETFCNETVASAEFMQRCLANR